uniref:BTB domain-containing protein n=1 Tax=Glossina austeni TaxID=7395 RepID=A0A1A9V6H0_GLOAU
MSNKCRCDTSADDCKDKDAESENQPAEVTYEDPNYLKELFAILNQFRRDEKYCDFFFYMGEQKLCAHKVILSAASPFFNERFHGGCIGVEKEGTGKDEDDTPYAGDYRGGGGLDDAGSDDAGLDDACLDDTCLDDTFLNKGSAEGRKAQPVRESSCKNFESDQSVASCNIDDESLDSGGVSVMKEENTDSCSSDEPTVSFIFDWRLIDTKRVTEDETCCDDTDCSTYTSSCDLEVENSRYGSEKTKVSRSLISSYMDEVPLRSNKTFTRVANRKYIDKGHCSCEKQPFSYIYSVEKAKQKTTEPQMQIYEDTPLAYPSIAKREIEKVSLTTEYMDEPRSSVNNTPFPCGTSSIEEARGKWSNENTPAAYAFDPKKHSRIPRKWPSKSTASIYRQEEESAGKGPGKTVCFCDTKKEQEKIRNGISDTKEGEARIGKRPNKPVCSCDTKEAKEKIRKWPSKVKCSCDTKEEKIRSGKGSTNPLSSSCTTEEEERINKWPSKPQLSNETEENEERTVQRSTKAREIFSSETTKNEASMGKWPSNPILPSETEGEERAKKCSSKIACFCKSHVAYRIS